MNTCTMLIYFTGNSLGDLIQNIIHGPMPNLRELRPDIPEGLEHVLFRCMDREKLRRPDVIELARMLDMVPLEAQLAVGGAFLLVGSWLIARALRDRTHGIVVTPAALTPFDDAVEIAATVNLPQPEFTPAQQPGGGDFGGAGATGKY